jgi:hypothetical protein
LGSVHTRLIPAYVQHAARFAPSRHPAADLRLDAVVRDERPRVAVGRRHTGGRHRLAAVDAGGDFQIQGQQLRQQVRAGVEAVGVEDSGVESGMGVLERVLAGQFQSAVEGAEPAGDLGERFGADAPAFPAVRLGSASRRLIAAW